MATNRYPGICYFCNLLVKPGEGKFERRNGRWLAIHANCVIDQRILKAKEQDKNENRI